MFTFLLSSRHAGQSGTTKSSYEAPTISTYARKISRASIVTSRLDLRLHRDLSLASVQFVPVLPQTVPNEGSRLLAILGTDCGLQHVHACS